MLMVLGFKAFVKVCFQQVFLEMLLKKLTELGDYFSDKFVVPFDMYLRIHAAKKGGVHNKNALI